jgi:lysophospholipase L1-like esterase
MRYTMNALKLALALTALNALPAVAAGTKVLVTGDSITRQTGGTCGTDTYLVCNEKGNVPHEYSYSALLPGVSNFDYVVVYNSGRGGDTCQTSVAWTTGAFTGLPRGLRDRVSSTVVLQAAASGATVVSVLIGINDEFGIDGWHSVSRAATISCIKDVWAAIRSAGYQVRAMTYPPINSNSNLWGSTAAADKVIDLNASIRQAVIDFNSTLGGVNPVVLADTEKAWTATPSNFATYLSSDGVHPTPAGAHRIASVWYFGH